MTTQTAQPKSPPAALLAVPPKPYAHGLRDAHERPLVSFGKDADGKFTCWRVSPADAWDFPSLELRAANSWPCLILDVDSNLEGTGAERLAALYWGDIPEPNWTVLRESSGGVHAVWNPAVPVHRGEAARAKPMRLLRRSAEYLALRVGADAGFTGVLTHNPMARAQRGHGLKTNWLRREPWGLHELAAWVPPGWRRPKLRASRTEVGRNVGLFDALMRFAGSPANAAADLMPLAEMLNAEFPTPPGPLPDHELARIVANAERYRAEWIQEGKFYTAAEASEYQARRGRIGGKRSGQARRDRHALRDSEIVRAVMAGRTLRAVAAEWGIQLSTVQHVIRRDAPAFERPESITESAPWEAVGMSRRSWYRAKAKLLLAQMTDEATPLVPRYRGF